MMETYEQDICGLDDGIGRELSSKKFVGWSPCTRRVVVEDVAFGHVLTEALLNAASCDLD